MPRKALRTQQELEEILSNGGLELAEQYDPNKSYPKNAQVYTRCKQCGVEAHYRLKYIMENRDSTVCRACYWTNWIRQYDHGFGASRCQDYSAATAFASKNGFELIRVLLPGGTSQALLLVRCKDCGKQAAVREQDISFGCSCKSHPSTAAHYMPAVTREVRQPKTAHVRRQILTHDAARTTLVSDIPELMKAWSDERDPTLVTVWPSGADFSYSFTCPQGHTVRAWPLTYLERGCPKCRGNAAKGTGLFLADTVPELAAEWVRDKNGKWTPENVRQNSKRSIWWECLSCGYQWQDSPASRTRRDGQCCPSCGKIQGSIAWLYPQIASQWDATNPTTPWKVRPSTKLRFIPLWNCPNNISHQYRAAVASRIKGAECPECLENGKSRIEMRYFEAARKLFGNARSGVRFSNENFSNNWSADITARYRGHDVIIEYDGAYWHKDKEEVDTRKSLEFTSNGFPVVRIRESGLNPLPIDSPFYSEVFVNAAKQDVPAVIVEVSNLFDEMIAPYSQLVSQP